MREVNARDQASDRHLSSIAERGDILTSKKDAFVEFDDGSTLTVKQVRKLIDAEDFGVGQGAMYYYYHEDRAFDSVPEHHPVQTARCMVGVLEGVVASGNRERFIIRMNGLDRDSIIRTNDGHDPHRGKSEHVRLSERRVFWHDRLNNWEADGNYK
jgi:hypothetical protein